MDAHTNENKVSNTAPTVPLKKDTSIVKKFVIPGLLILVILISIGVMYQMYFSPSARGTDPRAGASNKKVKATSAPLNTPAVSGSPSVGSTLKPGQKPSSTLIPGDNLENRDIENNGLTGTYYDDLNFLGKAETRIDKVFNFDWSGIQPVEGIEYETYSVSWTGFILAPTTDTYTFYAEADDGVRLSVNGRQLINNWRDGSLQEFKGTISLSAGKMYAIKVEYYNKYHLANLKLSWSNQSIKKEVIPYDKLFLTKTGSGLRATYYADAEFKNEIISLAGKEININSQDKFPHSDIKNNPYSIKWEGKILSKYNQSHTFYVKTTGNVKIWIQNQLLLDKVLDRNVGDYSFDFTMRSETLYDIKVEFVHLEGPHIMNLNWESKSQKFQLIPSNRLYAVDLTSQPSEKKPAVLPSIRMSMTPTPKED